MPDNPFDPAIAVPETQAPMPSGASGTPLLPPHSIEAEQSVIGGLLLHEDALDEVADLIVEQDFYRAEHKIIFAALLKLANASQPIDPVTLHEELSRNGQLEQAGGLTYLAELTANLAGTAHIEAYAKIVKERSMLRQLIKATDTINYSAFHTEGRNAHEILDEAEQKILTIAESRAQLTGPEHIDNIMQATVSRIEELSQSASSITGLSTGFADLDIQTAGLQASDLIIVAGRPSMGKTAFGMNIAEHVAITNAAPTLVFSLEMPAEQLIMRMLASIGRIDQTRLRTGKIATEDWAKVTSALSLMKNKPMYIDDTPGLSPLEVRSRARRIAREHGQIGLILIDYLQLMQIKGATEGRVAEISAISRSLKALAKELRCPVVALSQLNRGVEQRTNKRPINSDLRESGAIEQDADVILFIYRDEVYNADTQDKGIAEIIIGKQRNGPIGTVKTAFIAQYSRFEDLAHYPDHDAID